MPTGVTNEPDARGLAGGAGHRSVERHPALGLLFKEPPFRSGDNVKIAWRITGVGDLTLAVTRHDGSPGELDWGPEPHSGSTYSRPGDEWGAGYHLDAPSCWTLHAARGDSRADVWLHVTA